mmetsp:Transcript_55600/g.153924  ORF Transcript_55600/g.153924 Transcript_55600/m.153924 type:complete len:223 (+) Transcript_55600:452-1120(+)
MAMLSLMSTKNVSLKDATVPDSQATFVCSTFGFPTSHMRRTNGLINLPLSMRTCCRSEQSSTSTFMHHLRSLMYFFFWYIFLRIAWILMAAAVCSWIARYMSKTANHQRWMREAPTSRMPPTYKSSTCLTTSLYFVVAARAWEPKPQCCARFETSAHHKTSVQNNSKGSITKMEEKNIVSVHASQWYTTVSLRYTVISSTYTRVPITSANMATTMHQEVGTL